MRAPAHARFERATYLEMVTHPIRLRQNLSKLEAEAGVEPAISGLWGQHDYPFHPPQKNGGKKLKLWISFQIVNLASSGHHMNTTTPARSVSSFFFSRGCQQPRLRDPCYGTDSRLRCALPWAGPSVRLPWSAQSSSRSPC